MKLIAALALLISLPKAKVYGPIILEASKKYGMDPYLVAAVIYKESKFRLYLCHRGSYGLMQIQLRPRSCPKTKAKAKKARLSDARSNIYTGVQLMRLWKSFCKKHHSSHHWLLHYNQGYGRCPKHKKRCRNEEREPVTTGLIGGYADRVLGIYNQLKGVNLEI